VCVLTPILQDEKKNRATRRRIERRKGDSIYVEKSEKNCGAEDNKGSEVKERRELEPKRQLVAVTRKKESRERAPSR